MEVKSGKGQLNTLQRRFKDAWGGIVIVAREPEEAVREFWKAYSGGVIQRAFKAPSVRRVKGCMGGEEP